MTDNYEVVSTICSSLLRSIQDLSNTDECDLTPAALFHEVIGLAILEVATVLECTVDQVSTEVVSAAMEIEEGRQQEAPSRLVQ